jgi:transcriptional regulator with XRE-family HTH domain
MEKKTIGKFIAVLRKANGMTQRELGDKLFVSDKTVSRWERDECTPELSLIPSIAEIFGITADELLRGERRNPDRITDIAEESAVHKTKSDKQFRLMLDRSERKYKNCTLISVGVTVLGLLGAMIVNIGFDRAWVAFFLAAAFCVASEICQICFAVNARILTDEDDDTYTDRIENANTRTVKTAVGISFFNLLALVFCLPLVLMVKYSKLGLNGEFWFINGFLLTAGAALIGYIGYTLFVYPALCARGMIVLSERDQSAFAEKSRLLLRTVCVALCIEAVLGVSLVLWNSFGSDLYWNLTRKEYIFDTHEEFKAFMENEYDKWYLEGYSYVDENGNVVVYQPIGGYPNKTYQTVYGDNGEVLFRYYHQQFLYESITFTESSPDKMPVTVIPRRSYDIDRLVSAVLVTLLVLSVTASAVVYLVKKRRLRSRKNAFETA